MRDWRDSDPGYSSNDARHPRNRPPGSDAFTVDPAVVAGMVAAMRSGLATSRRPQLQRPAARVAPRPGRPQAGHQKSYSERRAAPERPERPRYHTQRGRSGPWSALEAADVDAEVERMAGRVCRWW